MPWVSCSDNERWLNFLFRPVTISWVTSRPNSNNYQITIFKLSFVQPWGFIPLLLPIFWHWSQGEYEKWLRLELALSIYNTLGMEITHPGFKAFPSSYPVVSLQLQSLNGYKKEGTERRMDMEDGGDGNLTESKKAATTEEKEGCLVFLLIQALHSWAKDRWFGKYSGCSASVLQHGLSISIQVSYWS